MPTVTNKQVIAGLYAAFFNRAPDAEGLANWEAQAGTGAAQATFDTLAAGFASHPKFTATYPDSMTNKAFVEAIYLNALGQPGDAKGVADWTANLDGGMSKSDMVSSFVYGALAVDLTAANFPTLTTAELVAAQQRQDAITNKVEVGIYFSTQLGSASNLSATTDVTSSTALDADPAYAASVLALSGVTFDPTTVTTGKATVDATTLPTSSTTTSSTPIFTLTTAYEKANAFEGFNYSENTFTSDNTVDPLVCIGCLVGSETI